MANRKEIRVVKKRERETLEFEEVKTQRDRVFVVVDGMGWDGCMLSVCVCVFAWLVATTYRRRNILRKQKKAGKN